MNETTTADSSALLALSEERHGVDMTLRRGDRISVPSYAALRKAYPRRADETREQYAERIEKEHKRKREVFSAMVSAFQGAAAEEGFRARRISAGKAGRSYSVSYARAKPRKESLKARAARLERELAELRASMTPVVNA